MNNKKIIRDFEENIKNSYLFSTENSNLYKENKYFFIICRN